MQLFSALMCWFLVATTVQLIQACVVSALVLIYFAVDKK